MLSNVRTCLLLFAITLPTNVAQDQQRRIGLIDFFGYAGLNVDQIRSALPIRVGDTFPGPRETKERINKAVTSTLGRPPTDVSPVCCDAQGNYIIFVGLPGTSIVRPKFNPVPKGKTHFPSHIVKLYEETMDALSAALLKGNAREDTSKGYALSIDDEALRAKQLSVRAYAIQHEKLIRAILRSSRETQQRVVAAYLLGYSRRSRQQIADLVRASNDSDETVRNNAIRALSVLADSSATVAALIPADGFVKQLSSGSWTDRNKAGWVLSSLTKNRHPKLLAQIRSQALTSLIEMARWQSGHSQTARIILGRVAGIPEERLVQLVNEKGAETIINALRLNQ